MWFEAERQARDPLRIGHPARNSKPSLRKLDFDIRFAVESPRPENLEFLLKKRVKRIENGDLARVAGIILVGWEARRTGSVAR